MRAPDSHGALISAMAGHLRSANHQGVASLLHPGVVLTVDSGDVSSAVSARARGRSACAGELVRIVLQDASPSVAVEEINGAPGLVLRAHGEVVGVIVASARAGLLTEVWAVLNPVKLGHLDERAFDFLDSPDSTE
jgi:RNA polymerase sigma-70 factor (ECF subfamily)